MSNIGQMSMPENARIVKNARIYLPAKYNTKKYLCGFGILWGNDHNIQICVISINTKLITLKADPRESSMWDAKFKNADYSVNIGNQKEVGGGEGFDVSSAELLISDLKNGLKTVKKGVVICAY